MVPAASGLRCGAVIFVTPEWFGLVGHPLGSDAVESTARLIAGGNGGPQKLDRFGYGGEPFTCACPYGGWRYTVRSDPWTGRGFGVPVLPGLV